MSAAINDKMNIIHHRETNDHAISFCIYFSVIYLDGFQIIDITWILECHSESQIQDGHHPNVLPSYKICLVTTWLHFLVTTLFYCALIL